MFRQTAFGMALSTLVLVSGLTTNTYVRGNTDKHKPAQNHIPSVPSNRIALSTTLEQSVFNEINRFRVSHGLRKLSLNASISRQARIHSLNMAKGKAPFSHHGFIRRVNSVDIGYSGAAENLAFNQGYNDPANEAVISWLNSPGHLENIEGNYNLTGIGVATNSKGEVYLTQLFIRTKSATRNRH